MFVPLVLFVVPSVLFNYCEQFSGIDGSRFLNRHPFDHSILWRLDLILHFHRFHHQDSLVRAHLSARLQQYLDDLSRHRRTKFDFAVVSVMSCLS